MSELRCLVQLARPFLPGDAITYLHSKSVSDITAYKARLALTLTFLHGLVRHLKFPFRTLSAAMVYYQRYYLFNAFSAATCTDVALAALFVASKNEDTIKKLRDIVYAAHTLRGTTPLSDVVEENRKSVLHIEKQMLETVGFDFRTYHSDEYLVRIAKDLGISFDLTYICYMVLFDSLQTEVALKVPAHAVAIASIIIAAKFRKDNLVFPLDSLKYKCPREWVNEAIFDVLDLYINNYNTTCLSESYPDGHEAFMQLRIDMKGELGLQEMHPGALRRDHFFAPKDYAISDSGSARYMLGNQEKRFYKEIDAQNPKRLRT